MMLLQSTKCMVRCLSLLALVGIIALPAFADSPAEKGAMKITHGKNVSFEYSLTVDGQVVDSNVGKTPLEYIHGEKKLVPGLEKAMEGMAAGESKKVTVLPEDGYGEVDQRALTEVNLDQIPPDARKVGMMLGTRGPNGEVLRARVKELNGSKVTLDFNHPLAGKTLEFDVKIVSVK